jgi:2-polyprenyl-6-hydroxyphenyl methylase/3-demethylubiquinone-9 3-methyltransferase
MVRPMRVSAHAGTAHADEVASGDRFEFGANWRGFLDMLDDERVAEAERSLREMLGIDSLEGRRFLDVGSGSGLFSLAARRLGAARVHSFDFDPESVACTRKLRERYYEDDPAWTVEEGSIVDEAFVKELGLWDVVYAWGVLHHTGAMWRALELVQSRVDDGGWLFISIYNDQGVWSNAWRAMKRTYNLLPRALRPLLTGIVFAPRTLLGFARSVLLGRPRAYVRQWTDYKRSRGMSRWHDIVDWMGGYPFEVAKPEDVFDFLRVRGFQLERLTTRGGGNGCNEYVFRRASATAG